MTLEDELSKIRAAARGDAPLQAAYQDLLSRLDRAETGARALKPGDAIPAFLLPDAEGRLVASDDLLARGCLVINFFRGNWCPYCRQTLKALDWFELKEVRGTIVDGKVGQYQVTLDVGFRYLTDEEMRAWVQG